jgi:3'-phosphoadenosine 5'-phosphosulfate (PAPS) 3'-phosphatase
VEDKGSFDMVTEADRACEKLIVERLGRYFPDHSIIGEEGATFEVTRVTVGTSTRSTEPRTKRHSRAGFYFRKNPRPPARH